ADAAADLVRRTHRAAPATRRLADRCVAVAAVRRPADHGGAVSDAPPGRAWRAGRARLPADQGVGATLASRPAGADATPARGASVCAAGACCGSARVLSPSGRRTTT